MEAPALDHKSRIPTRPRPCRSEMAAKAKVSWLPCEDPLKSRPKTGFHGQAPTEGAAAQGRGEEAGEGGEAGLTLGKGEAGGLGRKNLPSQ